MDNKELHDRIKVLEAALGELKRLIYYGKGGLSFEREARRVGLIDVIFDALYEPTKLHRPEGQLDAFDAFRIGAAEMAEDHRAQRRWTIHLTYDDGRGPYNATVEGPTVDVRDRPVEVVPAEDADRLAEALRGMFAADACQMEEGTEEPCQCNACLEARAALSAYQGDSDG